MRLKYVTLTGIDESVDPKDILRLSEKYPFVEWAILFSAQKSGMASRYPSISWVEKFLHEVKDTAIHLSAHLCGQWVSQTLEQGFDWVRDCFPFWGCFKRNQLNLGKRQVVLTPAFVNSVGVYAQTILGGHVDKFGLPNSVYGPGMALCPLFDTSGGKGLATKTWPKPIPQVLCGYAGGLGPDNISQQLVAIEAAVGDAEIWIDMESSLRTEEKFDIAKAELVLNAVALEGIT